MKKFDFGLKGQILEWNNNLNLKVLLFNQTPQPDMGNKQFKSYLDYELKQACDEEQDLNLDNISSAFLDPDTFLDNIKFLSMDLP